MHTGLHRSSSHIGDIGLCDPTNTNQSLRGTKRQQPVCLVSRSGTAQGVSPLASKPSPDGQEATVTRIGDPTGGVGSDTTSCPGKLVDLTLTVWRLFEEVHQA